MEPRPPRPRSPSPFDAPGAPDTAGIGERLYPRPGETAYYAPSEPYVQGSVPESALMPRRQRRQRTIVGRIAIVVVAIALIVGAGWFFRDAFRDFLEPPPAPTPVAGVAAIATPTAEPAAPALPNALATVTPTPGAVATATPRPQPTVPEAASEPGVQPTPDRDISAQTLPLLEFLPTQSQMPAGLVLADEAERSKADVIAALGGTEEAAQLLDDWGWSGNAFRDFIADETNPSPNGTTFLNVSVHRFADAASAANAMVYFSDYVIFEQGLQEVEPPAIGESARLLVGAPAGVPLAVLYAQQGPIMYRIGGSSSNADSDPTADVLAVAQAIIAGQGTDG